MTTTADVRLLDNADLEGALALSSASGWNQRHDDWRLLLSLAPSGSFAAVHGGRIVGTAIGIDYGTFGWIAMMLVAPDWRGRGLGARLLEASMGALPPDRAIRLDATPLGRPLYRRYGFEDETALTRFVAAPSSRGAGCTGEQPLAAIRPLADDHLGAVTAADGAVFGADRRITLTWMREGAQQYARVIAPAGVQGYCFGRQGRLFDQIGPVVAADDATACALAAASLAAAAGRAVVVDAFERERAFTAWLQECGFRPERPLFRMCRGAQDSGCGPAKSDRPLREFAILGPELG
jgi:GNAT superfamily N-acetyltransferase